MPPSKKELDEALSFDALRFAEQLTGESYKNNQDTAHLGVALHIGATKTKHEMLEAADDTTHSNSLDRYLRIIGEEGFEQILVIDFISRGDGKDQFFIFYHEADGILLVFDTFNGSRVNGGHFYYNIKPHDPDGDTFWGCISSGGLRKVGEEMVWVGDHDCREALRHHIAKLRENGDFLQEWVKPPSLWLLHHGDISGGEYDHRTINAERIAMLPEKVQKAIAGKSE